jgi:hypothetical protein
MRYCAGTPAGCVRASRSRLVSRAGAADTAQSLGRDLSRDTGDAAGLASQTDREELILGQAHLRAVLTEYQMHYNTARPHQGIAQRVPDGPA